MKHESVKVVLNGREFTIARARLGLFLRLETISAKLVGMIKRRDSGGCVFVIAEYLELATGEPLGDLTKLMGVELFSAYLTIKMMNFLDADIPLLKKLTEKTHGESSPWEYDGGLRYTWIHLLASTYHWPLDQIENLWPEEAVAFIQEILVQDQLQREWDYGLSEHAYSVDKEGVSRFMPLPRPAWMVRSRPKKTKMLRRLLPSGHIIDLSGVTPDQLDD
jgi:hypothetical protein